jgi:hypothetical protein
LSQLLSIRESRSAPSLALTRPDSPADLTWLKSFVTEKRSQPSTVLVSEVTGCLPERFAHREASNKATVKPIGDDECRQIVDGPEWSDNGLSVHGLHNATNEPHDFRTLQGPESGGARSQNDHSRRNLHCGAQLRNHTASW